MCEKCVEVGLQDSLVAGQIAAWCPEELTPQPADEFIVTRWLLANYNLRDGYRWVPKVASEVEFPY